IDVASWMTTRSWARNSPMQISAVGDAAPPSRVVKLTSGAGRVRPLRPTARPATGAINSGLRRSDETTLVQVDQKLGPFCRSISTITTANRNNTQAVNSVAMIDTGALSGPNTKRHIGMHMKPTLL